MRKAFDMKKTITCLFVFSIILLITPEKSQAQGLELRAGAGISQTMRTHQQGQPSGFLMLPGLRYRTADRHFAVGLDLNYNYFDFENDPDASYTRLGYIGSMEYYLSEDKFHVYLGLSGGYFDRRQDVGITQTGSNVVSNSAWGIVPRGGIDYELSHSVSAFADFGFRILFTGQSGSGRNDGFVDASFGLSFKLYKSGPRGL